MTNIERDSNLARFVPSGWQLVAVLSWLLVLTVVGVLTMRLGPWTAWLTYGLQFALIAGVFMRVAWDARVNWILGLFALCMVVIRFGLVLIDRAEYQPELDHFESTRLDPTHVNSLPAD